MYTFFLILVICLIIGIAITAAAAEDSFDEVEIWVAGILLTLVLGAFLGAIITLGIPGRYKSTVEKTSFTSYCNNYIEQSGDSYLLHTMSKDSVITPVIIPICETEIRFSNTPTPYMEFITWQTDWSKVRNYWSFHACAPSDKYILYLPQK